MRLCRASWRASRSVLPDEREGDVAVLVRAAGLPEQGVEQDQGSGMNLRHAAEMRPCMIRLPGICSHNDQQTVLCHGKLPGISGAGLKAPDLFGAWGCLPCHDEVDRRTRNLDSDFVRLAFLEGVMRTQYVLIQEGKVRW